MLRFKALNDEDSSSSEAEDEGARNKPTREALEEEAASLYNKGLQLLCHSKKEEAEVIFEELLESSFLQEEEDKSPLQTQIRLGCLKNLSIIFSNDSNRLECAQRVLVEAVSREPKNVTLWSRLGSIGMKRADYHEAYYAFQHGLKCSPHHWICVENLVTLAFVLGDYLCCLYYCAYGLEKDPHFTRGAVFRDVIFDTAPFIVESGKVSLENWDSLLLSVPYDACWKTKYLKEANLLIEKRRETVSKNRLVEETQWKQVFVYSDKLKSYSLEELCESVLTYRETAKSLGSQALLQPVDMSSCVQEDNTVADYSADAQKKPDGADESSRHGISRNQGGPEEKECNFLESGVDKSAVQSTNGDIQRAFTDEDCSQSQDTQEPEPKKKSRKDVKWWQYEGKRRSQRVRGHLMPISQTPSKNERGFAETLKNLIHSSLLCVEPEVKDGDCQKPPAGPEPDNYFGNQVEVEDVKRFILTRGQAKFINILTTLVPFLCNLTCNSNWSPRLVGLYLKSCKCYREYRQEQSEWASEDDCDLTTLKQDAFIILSTVEFRLDSATPSTIEALKFERDFVADLAYLDIVLTNGLKNDLDFRARYYWFKVNYELLLAQVGIGRYTQGLYFLKLLERILDTVPSYVSKIGTKQDNVISLEEVRKKIRFVKKMENISRISELYQSRQYEALIEILQLCVTSEDHTITDLTNRFYLAESYFYIEKYTDCVAQCVKIVTPCLKHRNDEILGSCLSLLEKICIGKEGKMTAITMKEKRLLTNSMIEILTWNENKGTVPEAILITPWCILHSILFDLESKEPVLYLDEESAPNSVVLLQFAHEFLNRTNKCTICDGKLLTYTVDVLFAIRTTDDHGSYEETKHCIEQAIFCLYSHPNKKSKIKYLSEHSTNGIELKWSKCLQLYEYYKPEDIPEFDSYQSISSDVEGLFQRILSIMPEELKPKELDYEEMIAILEGTSKERRSETNVDFPPEFINIYYLLGDHYFKTKEWTKSVEYYTYDLTVIPSRFDSWAAIALAKGEMIGSKLNACENYVVEEVLKNSDIVVNCFQRALDLEPNNSKIRIEFGSFIYAMHSFCSRLLKQGTESLSLDKFEIVEVKKEDLLTAAIRCFEPIAKPCSGITDCAVRDDEDQHELWIHHYLLGKVMEKRNSSSPEKFLNQFEVAGKLIYEQGAPYPAKINFHNPPELAIEALEIHFRIHASILNYIEKHEYDEEKEKILAGFIERAASSPFIKCKQSRGGGGADVQERKKRAKDEKKDQAEIKNLVQDMLKKVEEMVNTEINSSSSSSSGDDDDTTSVTSSQASTVFSSDEESLPAPQAAPVMSSFGLSAFREKLREKEMQETKLIKAHAETSKVEEVKATTVKTSTLSVESPASLPVVETNKFYKDFANVKYRLLISKCLVALEECITRFPQHHKSYFRLSYTYATLSKDKWKICKDYLLGNTSGDKKKVVGLFADRKAANFFNNVWRNPIDDIDRPGSFPYHMARTIQHLLEVLDRLNDHQFLAEVAIALSKVPEQDKQYLYDSERQQFSHQAFASCVGAAKRYFTAANDMKDGAISIFETYQKLQKYNSKENVLGIVLLECYKQYLDKFGHGPDFYNSVSTEQAVKFFQHMAWASKLNPGSTKVTNAKPVLAYTHISTSGITSTFDVSTAQVRCGESSVFPKQNDSRKSRKESASLLKSCGADKQMLKSDHLSQALAARAGGENFVSELDLHSQKRKLGTNFAADTVTEPHRVKLPKISQSLFQSIGESFKAFKNDPVPEKTWKDSFSQECLMKPQANISVLRKDVDAMDLSHPSENGKLKRKPSADVESVVSPPKKLNVSRELATFSELTKNRLSDTNQSGSKFVVTKSNYTPPPTSCGIPLSYIMDCMEKNKNRDILVEKQKQKKKPSDFVKASGVITETSKFLSSLTATTLSPSMLAGNSIKTQIEDVTFSLVTQTETSYSGIGTMPHYTSSFLPAKSSNVVEAEKINKLATSSSQSSKLSAYALQTKPSNVSPYNVSRNTSPFKAQATRIESPRVTPSSSASRQATPPPAHCRRNRAMSEWSGSSDEPEIIDLTTPPRKREQTPKLHDIPSVSLEQPKVKSAEELVFTKKPKTTQYPMPPKKSLQARHRHLSRESSEEPEVIFLD